MQNCLLNTIKFLHNSQFIVPFIITDKNLVTIKDVIQVDLLKLLNRHCIIIKYRPINIVHYKWIMKMIHCESNYRNSYFKDGFLYVTFTIPLRLQYTASQIMQYKLKYLNKDILIKNAKFWGDCFALIINEESPTACESSRAYFLICSIIVIIFYRIIIFV